MDDERRPAAASGQNPRVIGKVIKSTDNVVDLPLDKNAPRAPQRAGVMNAEQYEAKSTARQIIDEARAEAAKIVEDANRQRGEVFAKAAADAQADVTARSTEELARAKMQAGQILAASEGEMIDLALKIAAKIIGRDLERDPGLVSEIAATAIEHARASKAMVLRVNPKDGAFLRDKRPKLMEQIGRTVEIAIRDDADIAEGGCVIQTEFGTIDAQLKTQFEMLRNVLYPDTAKKEGPK